MSCVWDDASLWAHGTSCTSAIWGQILLPEHLKDGQMWPVAPSCILPAPQQSPCGGGGGWWQQPPDRSLGTLIHSWRPETPMVAAVLVD